MNLHYTPYMLPFVLSAVVLAAIISVTWKNRNRPAARELAAVLISVFIWAAGYALELASVELRDIIFWANVQYIGLTALAPLWLLMTLRYVGFCPLSKRALAALAIVPVITNLLAWTDSWHHLFRGQPQLDLAASPLRVLDPDYGFWFTFVFTPYFYVLFAASSLILLGRLFTARSSYRWQVFLLLIAVLLPLIVGAFYLLGITPIPHYNLSSAVITISGLVLAIAISRYRFLDVVPVARDALMESMENGIIVLDDQCRIVDINPAARLLSACPVTGPLSQDIGKALPAFSAVAKHCHGNQRSELVVVVEDRPERALEITTTGLYNTRGDFSGYLVVLRDVSERKRAEREKEKLIAQLQQALSEVKTLSGLLPICASCKRIRDDQGYWQQIETYFSEHSQAQFSHSLCPECLARLYPDYYDADYSTDASTEEE